MLAAYLAAVGVLALLAAVPGPDVAVVTRFALSSGRRPAGRAVAGVLLGLIAWGALAVAGLAAVLAASAELYAAVRVAGAAYLIVLGARALWRARRPEAETVRVGRRRPGRPLRTGLTTNLLNPKIAIFYASVLPSLVPHGAPADLWLAGLVLTHVAVSAVWLGAYALAFSGSRSLLQGPRARRLLDAATGVVLIGFGLSVATRSR